MKRSVGKPGPRNGNGRYWWIAGAIVAVGIAANLVVWLRPGGEAAEAPTYTTYPEEVVAYGESIFRANCATCHGPGGQGDVAAGVPALDGSMHAWHHPDSQIAGFIREGVGRMPPVGPEWSQTDVTAVLAYVKRWWTPEQRAYQEQSSRMNP